MRHHPHFRVPKLRVGLDSIDERGAARRGGKEAFEHDERGTLLQDGLKRLNRLGVCECEKFPFAGQTLLERRHQICGGNHDRGHPLSVSRSLGRAEDVLLL